ncbi:hypothetical protein MICAF_1950004 [Microcystis aeruginosa PCC 9807]|uniref:Uncharacterized protein n=1 Tax=Microcystis aeruginosa PCC 9807 TaxID=1160283 RepID=I4H2X4_MICAE|nr:hypothetical protein MICAF_1950004 [Microcystis aeruginosa PCC 9807]
MAINSLPILEKIGSMQKTAITLSPAANLTDDNWNFAALSDQKRKDAMLWC